MKTLILAASAAALLAATPVQAQQAPRHFAGNFSCGTQSFATEWAISPLGDTVNVRVYYQMVGSGSVNWLDLVESRGAEGPGLYDPNGRVYLTINGSAERMQATWTQRAAPGRDCQPFIVSNVGSAKDRFDAIFALMETPEPDEAVAVKVGEMTAFRPITFALPELDQQSYNRRYQELEQQFWPAYVQKLSQELTEMPVATAEERAAFSARAIAALDGGLSYYPRGDDFRQAYGILQQATDRYATSGETVADTFFSGSAAVCGRLETILAKSPGYSFDKLALAARVPTDYWSRDVAEGILSALKSCRAGENGYVRELTNSWPDIEQRQATIAKLIAEQARLLALPVSLDTLIETNNLQPDDALVQSLRNRSDTVDRFFNKPLATRRQDLLAVGLAAVTEQGGVINTEHAAEAPPVVKTCDALGRVSNLSWENRDTIRQACDTARQASAERQGTVIADKVTEAFAAALPESEEAKTARALCARLRTDLPYDIARKAWSICDSAESKLASEEKTLRCDRAVTASNGSPELLGSQIALKGGSSAGVGAMVCAGAEAKTQISFASSGFLMWGQQTMHVTMGENAPLIFVLQPSEEEGIDWQLAVEDAPTQERLTQMGVKADAVTACIFGFSACRS